MNEVGFCASTANIWDVLGIVVTTFKIVIPLILIVLGMVDLGKAVVSSDDKAISKATGSLIRRFIAAVVIFFVPTIVNAIFTAISGIGNDADYLICVQCVTGGDCDKSNVVGDLTGTGNNNNENEQENTNENEQKNTGE